MDVNLQSRILEQTQNQPDILVRLNSGVDIPIRELTLNEYGQIVSAVDNYEYSHDRSELEISTDYLFVPGLGYILPCSRVIWKGHDYVLKYGWHTNISNQTLCTWYLQPLEEDTPNKTVYLEMIDEIELVHFR